MSAKNTLATEKLEEVPDMSVSGLCIPSVVKAISSMIQNPAPVEGKQPLGRWEVGVNNFDKKYAYDHSN